MRPGAIETPDQELWVRQGSKAECPAPARDADAIRDRAVGALVGWPSAMRSGRRSPKPDFTTLSDMVGGAPFHLNVGQWTDDTALALALAGSLIAHPGWTPSI